MIASNYADVWTVLLGIGLVVTLISTVALIVGLAPARRAGAPRIDASTSVPPPAPGAVGLGSASAVRDRAAARARAAAAASSIQPSPVSPTARRYELTDVHLVPPVDAEASARPPGQVLGRVDDHGEPLVSDEEARAIVNHFAEHDPTRIAEVITQWIRSDQQHGHDVAW